MRESVNLLQIKGTKTLSSCCGHQKYPQTIVIEKDGKAVEFFSGVTIPRKKRFYRRDSEGRFFIPEVQLANMMKKAVPA
jgi:hypothetical protein